ncbi:MAG TPA: helix-turn-helix transcriptional regulator [Clostridia bacterium]|nr:helix-turn-helix transcriptional regulator [Clostridia bacterium]HOL60342.1 helix-turn-helix transcriptional regulator [Clostridia bacterium]HPO53099.1 helix-turn-helix transcriptional regulator [Clostridia bacterium]
MRFGDFLYTLRKEKGMTQTELADLLGVTNKAVSKWETGESYPETSLLVPIANVFGITVDELLRGERNTALEPAPEPEKPEPKVRQLKPMTKGEAFTLAGSVALILIGVLILITLSVNDINTAYMCP